MRGGLSARPIIPRSACAWTAFTSSPSAPPSTRSASSRRTSSSFANWPTRWRCHSTCGSGAGITAACLLGLGRALGEAIAVSQVIGGGTESHLSLFKNGGTMASIIALQFNSAVNALHLSSLYYLAALLLVIGVASNVLASWITRRFNVASAGISR